MKGKTKISRGKIMEGMMFYPCANHCGRVTKDDGGFCIGCQNGIGPNIFLDRGEFWENLFIALLKIVLFVSVASSIYKVLFDMGVK
jgi:hypothetical protein